MGGWSCPIKIHFLLFLDFGCRRRRRTFRAIVF
jgi:hypothetical protein